MFIGDGLRASPDFPVQLLCGGGMVLAIHAAIALRGDDDVGGPPLTRLVPVAHFSILSVAFIDMPSALPISTAFLCSMCSCLVFAVAGDFNSIVFDVG